MLGVSGKSTGSLILRKGPGGIEVEGSPPDLHVFPRRFLDRELNSAVRVRVVVPAKDPLIYEVSAIDGKGDLVAHRIKSEQVRRRRFWPFGRK